MKYAGFDLLLSGLFLAMALVFPIVFHTLGLGNAFLPMFFPIVAAGFLVDLPLALVVGILSPLVSAVLTGMPPFFPPIAFVMMAEGLVLSGLPALLNQRWRFPLLPTLALTLLIDRLVLLTAVILVSRWLKLPEGMLGLAAVIQGIPGLVLMFLAIPPLVKILSKRKRHLAAME
jgi:hypothetical protein